MSCALCHKESEGQFCPEHQEMFEQWTSWARDNNDKIGSENYRSPFEFKKPDFGDLKGKAIVVAEVLRRGCWTKLELAQMLANTLNSTSERRAREIISIVAKYEPVIGLSSRRGYYIATKPEHKDDAIRAWREIDSRIAKLEERRKSLIRFVENCK